MLSLTVLDQIIFLLNQMLDKNNLISVEAIYLYDLELELTNLCELVKNVKQLQVSHGLPTLQRVSQGMFLGLLTPQGLNYKELKLSFPEIGLFDTTSRTSRCSRQPIPPYYVRIK